MVTAHQNGVPRGTGLPGDLCSCSRLRAAAHRLLPTSSYFSHLSRPWHLEPFPQCFARSARRARVRHHPSRSQGHRPDRRRVHDQPRTPVTTASRPSTGSPNVPPNTVTSFSRYTDTASAPDPAREKTRQHTRVPDKLRHHRPHINTTQPTVPPPKPPPTRRSVHVHQNFPKKKEIPESQRDGGYIWGGPRRGRGFEIARRSTLTLTSPSVTIHPHPHPPPGALGDPLTPTRALAGGMLWVQCARWVRPQVGYHNRPYLTQPLRGGPVSLGYSRAFARPLTPLAGTSLL